MDVEIIKFSEHDENIDKLLKWQSDRHTPGTYYSDEYLDGIRKIINSEYGKLSEYET